MALSAQEVRRLAELARIELSDEDVDRLAPQLEVILDAVAQVSQVDTADVPPMSHPMPLVNVTRADEVTPGLTTEQALAQAPDAADGRFRVPRILGEEQ